jgi:starvation-inducible DNA-binding protein
MRGFHWNIKGNQFFSLHAKFEELYGDAVEKIDEIAERILTLGASPLHSFDDYTKASVIKAEVNKSDAVSTISATLDNISALIKIEREVLPLAEAANDEGTLALMSDYISQQEKLVWMLTSFMK